MDVVTALRNSKKGQLKYDRYWAEEGRTQQILDEISSNLTCLSISPKALALVTESNLSNSQPAKEVNTVNETENKKSDSTEEKKIHERNNYKHDLHFLKLQSEKEIPILEYEEERLKTVQELFEAKKAEYEKHSKELQEQIEQQYQILKKRQELEIKKKSAELQQIAEMCLKEAREKERQLNERYQMHTRTLSAKVKEAEIKQKQEEEELQKRAKEQEERKLLLHAYQKEIHDFISKHLEQLNCPDIQKHLHKPFEDSIKELNDFLQNLDNRVKESETENIQIENLSTFGCIDEVQNIISDINQAKYKASQESKKEQSKSQFKSGEAVTHSNQESLVKPNLIARKDAMAVKELQSSLQVTKDVKHGVKEAVAGSENISDTESMMEESSHISETISEEKKLLTAYIDPGSFHEYCKVMENFKKVETSYKTFASDVSKKKYRFELQKTITVSINTISNMSGIDVKEKMQKVLQVLSGQLPIIAGKQDPVTLDFCKYVVAKKLVEQAEHQIESNALAAFPVAAAALGICAKCPDTWTLILGHFYTKCPYLVPFYPPKEEGQSDTEYYKVLGYEFPDDKMEGKDTFLKRMSGMMTLYAAMIQSTPPPGYPPFQSCGIELGWQWIARVLNMDPRSDITATMLLTFLTTAGNALQKTYGKQFKKLLHVLCKDYFLKIKQVTHSGSGPVSRLEDFLQSSIKQGNISPPDGILSSSFWRK